MIFFAGYEINELLFELVDWDNKQAEAHYDYFAIVVKKKGTL